MLGRTIHTTRATRPTGGRSGRAAVKPARPVAPTAPLPETITVFRIHFRQLIRRSQPAQVTGADQDTGVRLGWSDPETDGSVGINTQGLMDKTGTKYSQRSTYIKIADLTYRESFGSLKFVFGLHIMRSPLTVSKTILLIRGAVLLCSKVRGTLYDDPGSHRERDNH
jgi:hypothetical protein